MIVQAVNKLQHNMAIFISAGHHNNDSGAIGSGYKENKLTIEFRDLVVSELKSKYPEIKLTVVPGIVSMFAFASKVGISIAEGDETVAVIPACYDLSRVKETAKNCDTMIFLKDGRYFDQVITLLKEAGFPDNSIFAIAQDVGTEEEIVKKLTLGEVTKDTLTSKYFSILVVS